ncbi:MAG: CYTH domain-containing protein, partial [Bacteroidales bacterium]|nr:CYTH domain-containing protein [Bacteroidales bacterium]
SFKQEATKVVSIRQGYLSTGGNCTIRVRIAGEKAVITVKSKTKKASFSRFEWEYTIPVEDAREMIKFSISGLIEKERYIIPAGNFFYEVDVFRGLNEGLVVAEIELSSEKDHFERPVWLGKEVTRNKRYYNAFLAKNPYIYWKKGQ